VLHLFVLLFLLNPKTNAKDLELQFELAWVLDVVHGLKQVLVVRENLPLEQVALLLGNFAFLIKFAARKKQFGKGPLQKLYHYLKLLINKY
jgi:hypothetical protein